MIVLSVACPFATVGQDPVGGAEQVLASIDVRLVREDYASVVLAASGSRVAGQLVAMPEAPTTFIDPDARAFASGTYRRRIEQLCREHPIDVVHYHGHDYVEYAPDLDIPQIATLHAPRARYTVDPATAPRVGRICVSHSQARGFARDLDIAGVIENGIAVERYRPAAHKSDFVLALGRICPEKGFDIALKAARIADLQLVLAGRVSPYETHYRYATEVISPLLDHARVFVGPVAGARKRRLLAEARCVVIAEAGATSSLVAMEALASGTPVVGFARGALPEIVEHGVTGLLVDDPVQLPAALERARGLSSEACRARARERFSAARMTSRYLELYKRHTRERSRRRTGAAITIATTDRELADLATEWDALCDRCADATPFQRPAWLLAWRRWFGHGGQPRVAVVRRGGRIVAIVPLELRGHVIRLIGEGVSDYLDAIVEPDVDGSTVRDAVELAGYEAWSLELAGLRPSSRLHELALGGRFADGRSSLVVALDRPQTPPRLDYEERRLERQNPRWLDETHDPAALLGGLFALHRARWVARGERSTRFDAALERFHRDVVEAMTPRGLVRMIGVALDGELRGVLYGFSDHGRFLFYLSGFDPDLARLSPGRLLIARAIERARDEGAFELDFLRGREPYKYEWGAIERPSATYRAELGRELRAGNSLDHR